MPAATEKELVECTAPKIAAVYRPREPLESDFHRLVREHFDDFQAVYDQRFARKFGFWRPIIGKTVDQFLRCGDLREGFARVRCPDCRHEFFVAFSCKQRCICPSCDQKRALLLGIHIAEDVCEPVAHRQFVWTIPKRPNGTSLRGGCGSSSASTDTCCTACRTWHGKRSVKSIGR